MEIERKIKKDYALAALTTYRIGGPAKFFIEIKEKNELIEAFKWAKKEKLKSYILGGGSNVIIPDAGIDGLVMVMKNEIVAVRGERIECGAGATLARVCSLALSNNLSGLEWSSGIPRATTGGAIRGNAGAFGISMADIVETVEFFNIKDRKFDVFSNSMCKFGYRNSIFKKKNNFLIWNSVLRLKTEPAKDIQALIEKSINFRKQRYPNLPSAGSVFKNLDPEYVKNNNEILFIRELKDSIGREGKISAGLIIDKAGLKGKSIGGIKISLEHANHIVNTGKGTAEEVIMLISYIKQQVRTKFGLQLQEEIEYFGF